MIFIFIAMLGATTLTGVLTWRLVAIAKLEGASTLFSMQNMGNTILHACLLLSWLLFMENAISAFMTGGSTEMTVGFGAVFTGVSYTCLSSIKKTAKAALAKTQ
jgi:hypothetical protein